MARPIGIGSPSGLPVNDLCAVPTHVNLLYLRASLNEKQLRVYLLIDNGNIRNRQDADDVVHKSKHFKRRLAKK